MPLVHHPTLAAGRWQTFTLAEQLGNVGSEVSRAIKWRERDAQMYRNALERCYELLDLTIADPRWRTRLKELVRAREFLADAAEGGTMYRTTLEDMDRYFLWFAIAARQKNIA